MSYKAYLDHVVSEFNKRLPSKPEFKEFLEEFHGRTFTLKIKKDAIYVFSISKNKGLHLTVSDSAASKDDMYIETDKEVFDSMVRRRKINIQHILLGKIKWKNIDLTDVSKIKKIFGIQSLKDLSKQ